MKFFLLATLLALAKLSCHMAQCLSLFSCQNVGGMKSASLHHCWRCDNIKLKQRRFWAMHVNPKWSFFSFLDTGFPLFFVQIVAIIVKTHRNTNLVASRCFIMKKTSLPLDVRRSKTPYSGGTLYLLLFRGGRAPFLLFIEFWGLTRAFTSTRYRTDLAKTTQRKWRLHMQI